ncbi:PAC2 family protein [Georgenia satyanarayanai]|uniref:PAC2 family protein n=1 Tax=Georgenia satyanarayanai TaxID=860221 RepID=UPI0021ABEBAF|nr:PAC2 family protein [Georgenia satyanarayanai]
MELYDVHPDAGDVRARVLVNALTGAMDAGHAAALAARHLTATLEHQRLLTFRVDELVDYRAHRPPMTFESWRWTDYEEPYVVLDVLRDDEGTELLLLHGTEPDLRWHAFVDAVIDVVERHGVQRTINIHGVPMGVPHTRPTTVTAHASEPGLVPVQPEIIGTVQVPGSVTGLLEYRLGQAGHQAVGFSANVPHYLAQSHFHQAAAELVRQTARSAELALPVGDLEEAATEAANEIERQVAASPEVTAVVTALEQQYDAFMRGVNQETKATLLAQPVDLPTADEIGAAVEAFLADHDPATGPDDAAGDDLPEQRGDA